MAEQVDIAVDLGVVPPPLPEILNLRQLVLRKDGSIAVGGMANGKWQMANSTERLVLAGEASKSSRWREGSNELGPISLA